MFVGPGPPTLLSLMGSSSASDVLSDLTWSIRVVVVVSWRHHMLIDYIHAQIFMYTSIIPISRLPFRIFAVMCLQKLCYNFKCCIPCLKYERQLSHSIIYSIWCWRLGCTYWFRVSRIQQINVRTLTLGGKTVVRCRFGCGGRNCGQRWYIFEHVLNATTSFYSNGLRTQQ